MRLISLAGGGAFNFIGGLGGISVPLLVIWQSAWFCPALVYITSVVALAALSTSC